MPVIERLVKKDDSTVVIHLDNGEKLFLSYEVVLKNNIRKSEVISDEKYEELIYQNRKYHIRQKALSYLARRVHSEKELQLKLLKKLYDKKLIDEVLSSIKSAGLLNDEEFAAQFADEKLNRKNWGINKVKGELIRRGINSQTAGEVINRVISVDSQSASIEKLAKQKLKILLQKESDKRKIKHKLIASLVNKGFRYEDISETLRKKQILTDSDQRED